MIKQSRPGRPARVTSDQIAKAALKIGLDKATVKNVADELGMSVPGLYHHVKTREELILLATAHAFSVLPSMTLSNIDLETFLIETSRDIFLGIVREPVIIPQIAAGNFVSAGMAVHLEWFLESLERYGFDSKGGYEVFALVMGAIICAATLQASDEALKKRGTSIFDGLRNLAPTLDHSRSIGELVGNPRQRSPERFDAVRMVIKGILSERAKV